MMLLACFACSQKAADNKAVLPASSLASAAPSKAADAAKKQQTDLPQSRSAGKETNFPAPAPQAAYRYRIIAAPDNTFGYEILQNERPLIRQTSIPGMAGNLGFTTSEKAGKVAELVIKKLKQGQMPPSVTPEEMKRLEVID